MSTACLSSGQRNGWRENCKDTLLLLKTEVTEHVMGAVTCRSLAKAACGGGDCFRSGALIADRAKFRMHEQSFIPHAQPGIQPKALRYLLLPAGSEVRAYGRRRRDAEIDATFGEIKGYLESLSGPKARNYIMGLSTHVALESTGFHTYLVSVALPHRSRAWPGAEGGAIASNGRHQLRIHLVVRWQV